MNEHKITVTQALIIINVVVFVLGMFVQAPLDHMEALVWGAPGISVFKLFWSYTWYQCFMEGEVWRLITYQFVHADVMHILFNMWALYFFGPLVEYVMGGKRFLAFYLVCGVAGALFSTLLGGFGFYGDGPMIGASAAIYGVMVAVAFMAPDAQVQLVFPPITLTMRALAIVVIVIACSTILFGWTNAGGEAGHLGGAIMGAIIMLVWKQVIRYRRNRWR